MRKMLCALAALFSLPTAAIAQDGFGAETSLVEALIVQARTPGPAWWKVSDSDTTVWILGSHAASASVIWDEQVLERRLRASRQLILPAGGRVGVVGAAGLVLGMRTYLLDPKPYQTRLAPDLARRVEAVIPHMDPQPPANANTMALAMSVMRLSEGGRGSALKPVSRTPGDAARAIAAAAKIRIVSPPAIEASAILKAATTMPEPVRQQCLTSALDVYDGREAISAATRRRGEAWAQGDLPGALATGPGFRFACPQPPVLITIQRRSQSQLVALIAQALARPGQVVAISSLNDVVARGGVIEQLKARGFSIVEPNRLAE